MIRARSPLLLLLILVGLAAWGARGATPTLQGSTSWDPRLNPLGVTLAPASDCSQGCWRLIEARFEDVDESGGLHHIFARALDAAGNQQGNLPWQVGWPDGSVVLNTKVVDWADFAMFGPGGCFDPAFGTGPYFAFMGSNAAASDQVHGIGLPLCRHVNFRLTWQWTSGGPPPATATSVPPTATSVPASPTATPSTGAPTASPTATGQPPAPTATPIPGGTLVRVAAIGPTGGALEFWDDDTAITIVVPAGAIDRPGTLSLHRHVGRSPGPGYFAVGDVWEWRLTYTDGSPAALSRPMKLDFGYRYSTRPTLYDDPTLHEWDGDSWEPMGQPQASGAHAAAITLDQGLFGVIYPALRLNMPLITSGP